MLSNSCHARQSLRGWALVTVETGPASRNPMSWHVIISREDGPASGSDRSPEVQTS
jgi:hypothetical protein